MLSFLDNTFIKKETLKKFLASAKKKFFLLPSPNHAPPWLQTLPDRQLTAEFSPDHNDCCHLISSKQLSTSSSFWNERVRNINNRNEDKNKLWKGTSAMISQHSHPPQKKLFTHWYHLALTVASFIPSNSCFVAPSRRKPRHLKRQFTWAASL